MRGVVLKKYKAFLMECKQSANDLAGDKCTLGYLKALSTEDLWTWVNSDGLAYNGHASYLGLYKYIKFKKEIWLGWESACGGINALYSRTT